MQRRRPRHLHFALRIYLGFPHHGTAIGIQRIGGARVIREIDCIMARRTRQCTNRDRSARSCRRIETPISTAGFRIQRIHRAGRGIQEQPIPHHGRLAAARIGVGERPFQFQMRHVRRGEARIGLKPRLLATGAPAIPLIFRGKVDRRRPAFAKRRFRARTLNGAAAARRQIGRDRRNLIRRKPLRHRLHDATGERRGDENPRVLRNRGLGGRAAGRMIMAGGASFPIQLGSELRRATFAAQHADNPVAVARQGRGRRRAQHRVPPRNDQCNGYRARDGKTLVHHPQSQSAGG